MKKQARFLYSLAFLASWSFYLLDALKFHEKPEVQRFNDKQPRSGGESPCLYAAGICCKSLRIRRANYVIETVTVFNSV